MERPPQRQWDPVAPSLLWAHELRREHVHLADQLDNTRTDLTSTTNTVTDLAKKIDDVSRQIQEVQTRCEQADQLRKVETNELEDCIQRVTGRFEALETEHAQLKRRVELFEKEYSDRVDDWTRRFGDIERRLPSTLQVPVARRGSEVLAPDSMPVDQSAPMPLSIGPTRGLSDTTWGSSCSLDGRLGSVPQHEEPCLRDSTQRAMMKQKGMGLIEYLDMAEDIGGFNEGKASLEGFVCGLNDSNTRALVVRRLDASRWSWSCLRAIVRELAGVEGQAHTDRNGVDPNHGDRGRELAQKKSKRKRMRRSIPIVPADEDDLRALGWHNARR
ncbi:hypothetical protein ATEIFO6365_0001087100 [Aspergillus terreus]|uniref:Uncharacterized protein n=1 Tax=Aspergillus terreus TaxID=33178 RepID=A0A5M3YMC5_ASPTE|nr:hypothetical protein ATETN484_0001079200 [Aspergillus terreus]GFF12648.1 hypothetical protein ATEIFO6365_0001087100 [Aspergillus terreus]